MATMKFLTLLLLMLSPTVLCKKKNCVRKTLKLRSPWSNYTCVGAPVVYSRQCASLMTGLADISNNNAYTYGKDLTHKFTGCDDCGSADRRCYCTITSWRYPKDGENGKTPPPSDLQTWEMVQDWTPLDDKKVHC